MSPPRNRPCRGRRRRGHGPPAYACPPSGQGATTAGSKPPLSQNGLRNRVIRNRGTRGGGHHSQSADPSRSSGRRPKHNRQKRQPGGARRAKLNANSRRAAAHQPKRTKGLVQPTHMFLLDKAPGARDPPAQTKTARTSPALPTCEPRAFFSDAGGRDNVPKTRPTSTGPRARSAPEQPRPEGPSRRSEAAQERSPSPAGQPTRTSTDRARRKHAPQPREEIPPT